MSITAEPAEAIIISGPRKGEFVPVPVQEIDVTPEAEALVEEMTVVVQSLRDSVRAMREDSARFQKEMKQRRKERNELLRAIR